METLSYFIIYKSMENGKKIITVLLIVTVLIVSGVFLFSSKKDAQYGYELTKQETKSGAVEANQAVTVVTGAINSPVSETSLAYINTWNGTVEREQK